MKKLAIAILLGTLSLFVWNAFSWMVLKLHDSSFKNIPESVFESTNIKEALPEHGLYHYPGIPADGDWEAVSKRSEEGPVITFMAYLPDGMTPFSPVSFLFSFLLNMLAVGMACYFLSQTNLSSYGSKILFVGMLGLFAGVVIEIPKGVWFHFPTQYVVANMIDYIIGWTLVGAILGRFLK